MEEPKVPTTNAAQDGGSFFGIPYGWPLIVAIIALIGLMWMARHPVRQVVWQIFFITGRVFGRWGIWLKEHGHNARINTSDKIAAQRADELQEKMVVLEDRIGHRAERLAKELTPIISKLDKSTHSLATSANALADINFEDAAERAFRAAMPSIEQGRNLSKLERNIASNTAKAMNDRVAPLRPALTTLKTEAPRLKAVAEQLAEIDKGFNDEVDKVNKAFEEFEETVRSEDRIKVASRHSIVIPWLIAVFITGIALSGVFLNFFLIERPMSEIVGEGSRIGGISLPQFAAMIVIFLEFVAGVILMDAAGFTKLIPAFASMSTKGRRVMFIAAVGFLTAFSILEATLAIAREHIIEMQAEDSRLAAQIGVTGVAPAPSATPSGVEASAPAQAPASAAADQGKFFGIGLSTFAQLILAVLIPWLLATAALPLEVIIRNSVFMIQIAGGHAMLLAAFICKTLATAFKSLGLFALTVYDLIIFAPLWLERRVKGMSGGGPKRRNDSSGDDDDGEALVLEKRSAQNQQKPPKRERERGKDRPLELENV